jgi:hypothetical protein
MTYPRQQADRSYWRHPVLGLVLCVFAVSSRGTEPLGQTNCPTGAWRTTTSAQELRTQDRAFALLVETYREFRNCQIESGYQARLRGIEAKATNDTGYVIGVDSDVFRKLEALMLALAGKERELEQAKVQSQVDNWITAYNCVRRREEMATGQSVPSQVDLREAATRLNDFVVIVPQLTLAHTKAKPQLLSARRFLLNTPELPLPAGHAVAPCTPEDRITEFAPPPENSDDQRL